MRIWRHHWADMVLAALGVLQFGLLALWAVRFGQLSLAAHLGIAAASMLLFFHNYSVAAHEFCHKPWFRWRWANDLYAVFNSVNLGFPVVLYNLIHLAHHRYDNGPDDPTSTYRHGRDGRQEHWFRYATLGIVRDETRYGLKEAKRRGRRRELAVQTAAVLGALVLWGAIDWRFLVFAYLPLFVWGQFIVRVSAYFGHFNATDVTSRYANSVNHYGRLWNLLMFNEGYHQEHHIRPNEHWSRRGETREKYADEMESAGTYVESFPPMFNLVGRENPGRVTCGDDGEEPVTVDEMPRARAG